MKVKPRAEDFLRKSRRVELLEFEEEFMCGRGIREREANLFRIKSDKLPCRSLKMARARSTSWFSRALVPRKLKVFAVR